MAQLVLVKKQKVDGAVLTYKSRSKKNSFVGLKNNKIVDIVEKRVISNNALIGVHYWKKTNLFFQSSKKLISDLKKNRKKREPYVSETYKYLIKKKLNIMPYSLKKNEYFLIGTPSDYNKFKKKYKNKKNDKRYII